MGSREDLDIDDDFSEIYKAYTGPQGSNVNNSHERTTVNKRSQAGSDEDEVFLFHDRFHSIFQLCLLLIVHYLEVYYCFSQTHLLGIVKFDFNYFFPAFLRLILLFCYLNLEGSLNGTVHLRSRFSV